MKMSKSKKSCAIALTAVALTGGSMYAVPPVNAATYRSMDRITLDPGTVIPVTLNDELSSDRSQVGDTFTADVDTSRSTTYNDMFRGAVVEGVVRDVEPQSGNDPGTLRVAFTRLRMPDGTSYVISGSPTSLDSKNLTINSNGVLVANKKAKDQSLTYAGIGAGAGALIGILSNGKIRIEDLLLGGGLGYAAGQILKSQQQQVHDVDLKPGTSMGVLLNNAVLYHRRGYGSSTSNGYYSAPLKFYRYNGQTWSYNPSTGERRVVTSTTTTTTTTRTFHRSNRKYYTYMGHPYYLDLDTGERIRLD